ncbi:MAG: hypothetical protein E7010_03550 [Alphaproteobacteria bacterium]|nr:hypothetical protein [Alphaproteobacteria bacterium]
MIHAYVKYFNKKLNAAQQKVQRQGLLRYAENHDFLINSWHTNKILKSILMQMEAGDILLTAEISCLGSSLREIQEVIALCLGRKIKLIIINGNYIFEDTPQNRLLLSAIDMVLAINSKLKSQIMRNKVQELRSEGKKLGRPSGSRNKSIKLSGHEQEIAKMLEQKISKTEIARRLGVNRMTLYAFLRQMQK